ncbi:hypothetical protein DV515_00000536 [Chloebia gouldiae]|uniref:Uncharacterized protein n=1 Tax=Chloebia gouldiae TaxID=44316 RepID=A0A3L8T2S9_CHLGU|nr:hypothetical protein DV515_00000536 [Chloebia gouldiae]
MVIGAPQYGTRYHLRGGRNEFSCLPRNGSHLHIAPASAESPSSWPDTEELISSPDWPCLRWHMKQARTCSSPEDSLITKQRAGELGKSIYTELTAKHRRQNIGNRAFPTIGRSLKHSLISCKVIPAYLKGHMTKMGNKKSGKDYQSVPAQLIMCRLSSLLDAEILQELSKFIKDQFITSKTVPQFLQCQNDKHKKLFILSHPRACAHAVPFRKVTAEPNDCSGSFSSFSFSSFSFRRFACVMFLSMKEVLLLFERTWSVFVDYSVCSIPTTQPREDSGEGKH